MRMDPALAAASSFVSTVCGGRVIKENTDKSKDGGVKKSPVVKSAISDVVKPVMSAGVMEKQRVTRILVAKTMLGEELAKDEPSPASLAVLRKAAFGTETPESEPTNPDTATGSTTPKATNKMAVGTSSESVPQPMATDSSVEPVWISDGISEVEVSDDAAMSIGDSDNEEGISEDYSRTGSSSGGESTTSRGSRKRPADESPERETKETSPRELPGVVTRSEGGCRIYVPKTPIIDATAPEAPAAVDADVEASRMGVAECGNGRAE